MITGVKKAHTAVTGLPVRIFDTGCGLPGCFLRELFDTSFGLVLDIQKQSRTSLEQHQKELLRTMPIKGDVINPKLNILKAGYGEAFFILH